MFTFHQTTTDRNITFSTKKRPNNIQCVDSAEARTCYIFKIKNISDSLLQYTVSYLLEIIYSQRDKQTDWKVGRETNRQTGRQRCRRLTRQISRGTGRRTGGQMCSSETDRQSQTDKLRDRHEQPGGLRQTERQIKGREADR